MQISIPALITILGMALVTYLTRIGGFWLLGHMTLSPRIKAWLNYLPGTVLVAIVAPTVLNAGFAGAGAALATVLVAARTRNILLSMLTGIGAILLLRLLLSFIR